MSYTIHPLPDIYGDEILRIEVGSTLHGTGLEGNEDHDEMGIYVEGPSPCIGVLESKLPVNGGTVTSRHYQYRTAGEGNKSQPHDTDLICYSLRKWCRLALAGNPSVLLVLFAPPEKVIRASSLGVELRNHSQWFVSRSAGHAFLGYMEQQRLRMTGQRSRAGRVRVMPDGQVDWKYAMHMLRLGYQGIEFLKEGTITLPVPGDVGDYLRQVRQGNIAFEDVIFLAEKLEKELKILIENSKFPESPSRELIDDFCIRAHLSCWDGVT